MTRPRDLGLFPTLRHATAGTDLRAGLVLAAVALPGQLATAHLAGLAPLAGLVAFAAGGIAYAAFGRQPAISVAADSTTAPVFAGTVAAVAASAVLPAAEVAGLLALIVGALLVAIPLARLGWIADLLSVPVGCGLMLGIAIHILVGQIPPLLAIRIEARPLFEVLAAARTHLSDAEPAALAIGAGVAAACLAAAARRSHWPVPLLALVLATVAAGLIDPEGRRLPRLGALAPGFVWTWPGLPDGATIVRLLPVALTVAFLCITQTRVVEQSLAEMTPDSPAPRFAPEIAAVGAGNLLAWLSGAFPVNASPPSSLVTSAQGARSQLATLTAVAMALLLLAFASGLVRLVPQAALAGILVFIALWIVPFAHLGRILRHSRIEAALAFGAATLLVVLPIETGAALAILLALLHSAAVLMQPDARELLRVPGTTVWWRPRRAEAGERVAGVLVFGLGGPLNFVTAPRILGALDAALAERPRPALVVLEAAGVLAIDITGAELLAARIRSLRLSGTDVALARLEAPHAARQAVQTGLAEALGPRHLTLTVEEAVETLSSNQKVTTGPATQP